MNADSALFPSGQTAKTVDDAAMQATPVSSMDRRSPTRQGSRGNKVRLSTAIIMRVVQGTDLLLLLSSGVVAHSILAPLPWPRTNSSLVLATLLGTLVTLICLRRSDAYRLQALSPLGNALKILYLSLLFGGGCMIVGLFMINDAGPGFREWSVCWLIVSVFLLTASRAYLARMLRVWSASGRLARRVAVVGAGEFSKEFIARLKSEPHAYTVVGLYDDRLSRIPGVQEGVRVRGTVEDLLKRSREEQIDLIVVALPLRAVDRIAKILEQLGSAVADICLTTDFAGYRYKSTEVSTIGTNPVILVGERPLKEWRAATKTAFDLVVGSLLLFILSPLLLLIALAIRLEAQGRRCFANPASVSTIVYLPVTNSARCTRA